MTTSRQQNDQPGNQAGGDKGAEQRSEGLLPAGKDDGGRAEDGRFEVAEEVNLDQQSDALRRVGKAPKDIAPDELPDPAKQSDG